METDRDKPVKVAGVSTSRYFSFVMEFPAEYKWVLLNQKRLELRASSIFRDLHDLGLQPILIKGWAAARNYPPDRPRYYADIDIAVSTNEFKKATHEISRPNSGLSGIDLHEELRHLDTVAWQDLFDRSQLIEIDNGSIRILSHEDHLRVMATHWLNDGGVNKERLWDIYYAVANRRPDFNWSLCLDSVSETRRGWVVCAIGLAHRYLGLRINDLPFRDELEQIPDWVIRTVEREWASDEPMRPLQTCLSNPKQFVRQLSKRFPPNPISATIQTESAIDSSGRGSIQVRNAFARVVPSMSRILTVIKRGK